MIVSETKKIAVWGLGNHALRNIIPAIHISKELEMHGVLSRNKDVVKDCCATWDCKSWTSSRDMLSDPNITIVYLATPPGLHYEHGLQVLESNKHLWCEKPFTTSLKSSKQLINLSSEKNLSSCEGFMYLYHPQFIQLKEYIDEGVLGNLKTIHCRFGLPKLDDPGFRFNKELGGSCLLDVGCYPVSAVLALFPDNKIEIVDSSMRKQGVSLVDISGRAHLKIDSKINCFLEWSYDSAYRNEIDIWADAGSLYTDKIFSKKEDYEPNFQLQDLYGNPTKIIVESCNHFELMLKCFSASIGCEEKLNQQRKRILNLAVLLEKIKEDNSSNQGWGH